MAGNKRCVICLNYVKVKIKVIERHSFEEQILLSYLLKKFICTPISNASFTEYLQVGNPSDWASLCHICEKQVKEALDIHKQILKMVWRINDLRRKMYEENFYDSDNGEDDNSGHNNVFSKLRESLKSDFRLKKWKTKGFKKSIFLKYCAVQASEGRYNYDTNQCASPSSIPDNVIIKRERVSNLDDDDYNYSDSSMQDAVDAFFNNSVNRRPPIDESTYGTNSGDLEYDDVENDIDDSGDDPLWRIGKLEPRKERNGRSQQYNKLTSGHLLPLESIPFSTKKCPLCQKIFANGSAMRRHYRENHLNSRRFQCPCCLETFARKEYLQCHVLHNHPEEVTDVAKVNNLKPYCQCHHCPSKFHSATALRRHVRRVHPAAGDEYSCDQCENKYKRKDSLISHKKFVHENGNKLDPDEPGVSRRTCNICGKIFRSETIKRRHIRESHEKIKEFNCNICPKTFARKSYLFRHIHNEHSLSKGGNPIWCKVCNKKCSGQAALSRHMQIEHKQQQNVKCKICAKSYTQIAALNIHVRFAHGTKSETVAETAAAAALSSTSVEDNEKNKSTEDVDVSASS